MLAPRPTAPPRCHPQVLLIENDVNTSPFTSAVHACVPPLPWAVSAADLADPNRRVCVCVGVGGGSSGGDENGGRWLLPLLSSCVDHGLGCCCGCCCCRADLRHLAVCSVDPPGCKDIDDALHVRALPNGNLEIGVRRRVKSVCGC